MRAYRPSAPSQHCNGSTPPSSRSLADAPHARPGRKIVAGEEDGDSIESILAHTQQVAAEAEVVLVDGVVDALVLLTVSREISSSLAVARIESPCSRACWIAFQRASCRSVGARSCLLPGSGLVVAPLLATLTAAVAAGSAGSRRGAPPEPSPEAMRSWSGFRASSERAAPSTPARGGASREAIVSLVQDGELAPRPLQHLDLRPRVAGPLAPGQQLERAPAILNRAGLSSAKPPACPECPWRALRPGRSAGTGRSVPSGGCRLLLHPNAAPCTTSREVTIRPNDVRGTSSRRGRLRRTVGDLPHAKRLSCLHIRGTGGAGGTNVARSTDPVSPQQAGFGEVVQNAVSRITVACSS